MDFENIFQRYEKSVFEIFVAVAISRFQIEMMNQLAEEVVQEAGEAEEFHRNCEPLRHLISENFHRVGINSHNVDRTTRSLLESIQTLNKVTSGMGVLHVVGKIEMARVGATESLGARLSEMSVLNETFKNNLGTLERECKLNLGLCAELNALEKQIKARLG